MKQADINRLRRAAAYLEKAQIALESAQESIYGGETERFSKNQTTHDVVSVFVKEVAYTRQMLEGTVHACDEMWGK